ncbi:hypothetical protein ASPZODRAFT_137125 [Penicilliopsis zonata CBS 506.65]|uniref:Secreted protein n=1 Tax=Penicilliopsis zonata CBS 506.65 TaxID=1073090 RepID=A0A1L9S6D3_9EURO|nr:hypothetical protein ASPZODRAFT_137125 [Penicilliopsis zonata CBS 506.65]OJJ42728.1 hypothetical protein ASPZODRAFT_137125 [Penicilliopsis zonata CBS 506.65]
MLRSASRLLCAGMLSCRVFCCLSPTFSARLLGKASANATAAADKEDPPGRAVGSAASRACPGPSLCWAVSD